MLKRVSPARDARFLFELLAERLPGEAISHREMPTFKDHEAFVRRQPYAAWYLIEHDGQSVGAIYLTIADEIGVHVLRAHRGKGYGKAAIADLMSRHPRSRYLANINPTNLLSQGMFAKLGFTHIQNTYEFRS